MHAETGIWNLGRRLSTARNSWLRSANRNNGNNVANVNSSGNCGNNNANNGNYVAPDSADYRTCCTYTVSEIRELGTGSLRPEGEIPEQRREGCVSNSTVRGTSSPPDIEDVIGFDALWESMEKCRRGVMWKGSVQSFVLNGPENIMRLCDELHSGTYTPRPVKKFTITSPKKREIVCVSFRDRVVQRSYNDVAIYPFMSRSWIYDNYACQTGKGTDFARERMRCHLERKVREVGPDFSVLCIDVKGYFDHLLFEVMGERFYQMCPRWAAQFACDTLRHQYGTGQGVNPGSQLTQIAGVDYLSEVDHFIKEELGVKGYGRYMDDLVLIHEDQMFLERCVTDVSRMMGHVGLEPHPTKTRMVRARDGFRFLGFDWRVAADGAVLMTLRAESYKSMRRRIERLHRLETSGLRSQGTTFDAYMGWRAHAIKGCGWRGIERCDEWFAELEQA